MHFTYYQPQLHSRSERSSHFGSGLNKSFEIVVGALLLLSPMFWLFIAELIK